jgi:8-oxo-dGTP diphosphatase
MPALYVIRHAWAGHASRWTGDDRLRPLTPKGVKQAEALVDIFAPYQVTSVLSSPYLRCVQTVQPVAAARGLKVQQTPALALGSRLDRMLELMTDPGLGDAVLSTHADLVWGLVEELIRRGVLDDSEDRIDKAATWALDVVNGKPARARYIPAP